MEALSFDLTYRAGDFRLEAAAVVEAPVTALLGASGAGKTTLFRLLAGLERPERGRIALGDRVLAGGGAFVPPWRRGIGLVFQEPRLWPHRRVRDIVRYGGRHREAEVIERLELGPLLDRRPATLSGGEQQRVSIARALLAGPKALLVDEPASALDLARRRSALDLLVETARALDVLLVVATHHVAEALERTDQILLLDRGRLAGAGPVDRVLATPDAFRVVDALGLESVLDVVIERHDDDAGVTWARRDGVLLALPPVPAPPGAAGKVGVRAEDVLLARGPVAGLSARNQLPGRVAFLHEVGGRLLVHVDLDGGAPGAAPLRAEVTRQSAVELGLVPGGAVWACVKTWSFRWRL